MRLKNYNKYLKLLLEYAKLCRVEVYENELEDADGDYYKRVINLDKKLSQSSEIAVLLHELGHFLDEMVNPVLNERPELNRAYEIFNDPLFMGEMTYKQRKALIACEKRAWVYGKVIAKKLKIKLGSWYDKEMRAGMSCYKAVKVRE